MAALLFLAAVVGCGASAAGGKDPIDAADAAPPGTGGASGGTGGADAATGGDLTNHDLPGAGDTAVGDDAPGASDGAPDGGDAGTGEGLKLPVARGDLDVLEFGSLLFKVNPGVGARIVGFALDGDELLTDATAHPQYYGSTLWTSPADDWVVPGTFVPPPVVDSAPYTTTVSADGIITATNTAYTTPNAKKFTVAKVFRADVASKAIVIDYKLTNTGTTPYKLSHWEVTRVFPGGLTFFATGTSSKMDFLAQPMQLKQAQGYTWYDNTTHMPNKGESKAGSLSQGGFIAHVAPHPKGDLLFVKAFKPIVPPATAPTGHYDIEMYCNNPHTYVELEDHSAFDTIMPGATYTQSVRWYLRRLPIGTDRSIGSPALIAAVKSLLGQ